MSSFDEIVASSMERYRSRMARSIYDVSPLMRHFQAMAEFEDWRGRIADQRFRRRHPWRWRYVTAKANLRHWRVARWRRLDPLREAAARRLAPWLVIDDRGDW